MDAFSDPTASSLTFCSDGPTAIFQPYLSCLLPFSLYSALALVSPDVCAPQLSTSLLLLLQQADVHAVNY